MKYSEIIKLVRKLRRNQTPEEELLWGFLRNRNFNEIKFVRQHPLVYEVNKGEIFFFVADFYCAEYRLVVELDGKIHDYQKEKDFHRDEIIQSREISVLRIKNEELKDMKAVLTKIEAAIRTSRF
ncbi:MAG: endonuclease domain-containing protein [Bacteroidota bacterium]